MNSLQLLSFFISRKAPVNMSMSSCPNAPRRPQPPCLLLPKPRRPCHRPETAASNRTLSMVTLPRSNGNTSPLQPAQRQKRHRSGPWWWKPCVAVIRIAWRSIWLPRSRFVESNGSKPQNVTSGLQQRISRNLLSTIIRGSKTLTCSVPISNTVSDRLPRHGSQTLNFCWRRICSWECGVHLHGVLCECLWSVAEVVWGGSTGDWIVMPVPIVGDNRREKQKSVL